MVLNAFATLRSGVRSSCRPPHFIEGNRPEPAVAIPRNTPQSPNYYHAPSTLFSGVLAVLILLRAAPVAAQDRASLVLPSVVLVGAQAADLHATHLVLSRGGVEHNPIMRQPLGTQAAIKALTTTAVVGGAYVLNKHRRPRASKIVVWSASAAVFAVAAHNYRHAQR